MTGCVEEERERKEEEEHEEKARIIGASSNRRPSQTSPFTFAYSTSLQPTAEDQKERISKLFHLRFHLPFLSGRSASFLLSWFYTRYLKSTALILDKLRGSSRSSFDENYAGLSLFNFYFLLNIRNSRISQSKRSCIKFWLTQTNLF